VNISHVDFGSVRFDFERVPAGKSDDGRIRLRHFSLLDVLLEIIPSKGAVIIFLSNLIPGVFHIGKSGRDFLLLEGHLRFAGLNCSFVPACPLNWPSGLFQESNWPWLSYRAPDIDQDPPGNFWPEPRIDYIAL